VPWRERERGRATERPRQAPFASDSSNISPLPPLPPLPKTKSYTYQIIGHPKATASWSMIPQPRGGTPTAALPIRSDCTLKIPWASTTKYNIILPEMRR
jgi:hypothetical protein